jgi:hypothetical protein
LLIQINRALGPAFLLFAGLVVPAAAHANVIVLRLVKMSCAAGAREEKPFLARALATVTFTQTEGTSAAAVICRWSSLGSSDAVDGALKQDARTKIARAPWKFRYYGCRQLPK